MDQQREGGGKEGKAMDSEEMPAQVRRFIIIIFVTKVLLSPAGFLRQSRKCKYSMRRCSCDVEGNVSNSKATGLLYILQIWMMTMPRSGPLETASTIVKKVRCRSHRE